jgi:hypothetical protein
MRMKAEKKREKERTGGLFSFLNSIHLLISLLCNTRRDSKRDTDSRILEETEENFSFQISCLKKKKDRKSRDRMR